MFFILSKTVAILLRPSILICLIGAIGLLLMAFRHRRIGRTLTIGCFIALVVLGLSPLASVLSHTLESRFPPWQPSGRAPDGIVLLGGSISPAMSRLRGEVVISSAADRIFAVARLARAYPQARIVYAGGDGTLLGSGGAEADYVLPLLDLFGISRDRVTLEARSRNTAENAAFSKALAMPKPGERWLLVTSARHMPRAVGCFRQAGFDVEAYPTDWQTDVIYRFGVNFNIAASLAQLDAIVIEWTGLLAYWLTGKTAALFPAP